MYQNLIQQKDIERANLAALMASFTGEVKVLSHIECAPYRTISYNGAQSASERAEKALARERDRLLNVMLVEHARALAAMGISSIEATRKMREKWQSRTTINRSVVERLAASNGFYFAYKGKK